MIGEFGSSLSCGNMQVVFFSVVDCVKDRRVCYSTQTSGRVARICIRDMYPAFADVTQVNDVKEEPRLQASSHYPSEQRRLGTEGDSFTRVTSQPKSLRRMGMRLVKEY